MLKMKKAWKLPSLDKIPAKIIFIISGIGSTIWFLIRVIPKPSRATYPCMRVAAPFMSGLIVYLLSMGGTVFAFKKMKEKFVQTKYFTAGIFLLLAVSGSIYVLTHNQPAAFADSSVQSAVDPNQPVGIARGVKPGRVVWVWNPEATNEDYYCSVPIEGVWPGGYWKDNNTNLQVVDSMMAEAVINLTGAATVSESWDSIFRYFNKRHDKGDIGYVAGEKIFIKPNHCKVPKRDINPDFSIDSTDHNRQYNRTATSPQPIIAIIRQLVNDCGVPDTCITMGDPHKNIYKHLYDPLFAEFPGLIFLAHDGGAGRLKVRPADTTSVVYSDKGTVLKARKDFLCQSMENADYLINIAANKGRNGGSSGTMTAKNHFGSISVGQTNGDGSNSPHNNAGHLHAGIMGHNKDGSLRNGEYGVYRVLTDLMGHKYIGQNTVLYVAYWPEGIRYDPENDGTVIPSLGVFERWNNPIDKQYTRNLGTGNGIELIQIKQIYDSPVADKDGTPVSFKLLNNYPNPFNPTTTICYELKNTSLVNLDIFNSRGRKVETLVSAKQAAGSYQVVWNASGFASGVYYCRLTNMAGMTQSRKLILLK